MKVLFLDHDGVICLSKQWGKRKSPSSVKRGEIFDPFCKKAIKVLNEIIKETDCEIVVSSDWRLYCDLNKMQSTYLERGIIKAPIGYTIVFSDKDADLWEETKEYKDFYKINARVREKEIQHWIDTHSHVSKWVAVDDLPMNKLKSFVHTVRPDEGIKQYGIKEKIIKKLNGDLNEQLEKRSTS
tara:strand:+ start:111 stop:662 length:552 start_codon:yes stop_codon:yes gene_type:complete